MKITYGPYTDCCTGDWFVRIHDYDWNCETQLIIFCGTRAEEYVRDYASYMANRFDTEAHASWVEQ